MPSAAAIVAGGLIVASCASGDGHAGLTPPPPEAKPAPRHLTAPDPAHTVRLKPPRPRIVSAGRRLQCVAYARNHSGIAIRGDAWTWWEAAEGRYARGTRPEVGAVLVLKKKAGSRGHLAVVRRVVDEREIIVDHANWLNRGRVHLNTPVRDESAANDWSVVRVWYTPGRVWGKSRYPAYGFIYPETLTAAR